MHFNDFKKLYFFSQSDELYKIIQESPNLIREISFYSNWCCIITNGSSLLGFGKMGAKSALPVMEGKSCLFSQLAGVNVVPIVINEDDPDKLI